MLGMGKPEKFERVTVAVSEDLAAKLQAAVASGAYSSGSEIVREALLDWCERQDRKQAAVERLRVEVDKGLEGPFQDGDEVMAKLRDRIAGEAARRRV